MNRSSLIILSLTGLCLTSVIVMGCCAESSIAEKREQSTERVETCLSVKAGYEQINLRYFFSQNHADIETLIAQGLLEPQNDSDQGAFTRKPGVEDCLIRIQSSQTNVATHAKVYTRAFFNNYNEFVSTVWKNPKYKIDPESYADADALKYELVVLGKLLDYI